MDYDKVIIVSTLVIFDDPHFEIEDPVRKALDSRPEIIELHLRKNRAEVDRKLAVDAMKPELGLSGGFGFQGEDLELIGSINEMDNFSWFAGLNYIIPLGGNRGAKARHEIALLAIRDIDMQLESLEDTVRREVLDALIDVENAEERLRVTEAGIEAALVKRDSERQRFDLGLITAGDLLRFEDDYSEALLGEVNARVELLQAAALLSRLTHSDPML